MFQMMGVFAEFERAMIRERVLTGLARAREQGVQLGRRRLEDTEPNKAAAIRRANPICRRPVMHSDDLVGPTAMDLSPFAGEFDRPLDRFGAAVGEERPPAGYARGHGDRFPEDLRETAQGIDNAIPT
jgi:Resolvase, N terminal domain